MTFIQSESGCTFWVELGISAALPWLAVYLSVLSE